jgi:hypothetical protein
MTLMQPKNPIFHHSRPRNGSGTVIETAIETLERAASTSPSGNERPWEVSGQASRRVSRARVVVPPAGAWSWVVTKYCRHPAYSDPKTYLFDDPRRDVPIRRSVIRELLDLQLYCAFA